MKLLLIFVALIFVVSSTNVEEQWKQFKATHGKSYRSLREEKLRYNIFKSNVEHIEQHNAKFAAGEVSYTMKINKFADLTREEFRQKYLNYKSPTLKNVQKFEAPLNYTAPDSIDWREKGAVLDVRDQGQCGSCWAFSATGALEGQNAIKHGQKVVLSTQELVDCSTYYGNEGCDGGDMGLAFEYIEDNGISTDNSYPYTGEDGRCGYGIDAGISVSGYVQVNSGENNLKNAVGSVGPISVAMYADLISYYDSGVFDDAKCSDEDLDHGVLAVGYGSENGQDYWIIKNSWGSDWGEDGYFRLAMNKNLCGIGNYPLYPNIQ